MFLHFSDLVLWHSILCEGKEETMDKEKDRYQWALLGIWQKQGKLGSPAAAGQREVANSSQKGQVLLQPCHSLSLCIPVSCRHFPSHDLWNERVWLDHKITFSLYKIFLTVYICQKIPRSRILLEYAGHREVFLSIELEVEGHDALLEIKLQNSHTKGVTSYHGD